MNVENAIKVLVQQGKRMTENHEETGSEWIKWDGASCPVPISTLVNVRYRDGTENRKPHPAAIFNWKHGNLLTDIVAYKIFTIVVPPVEKEVL